MSRVGVLRPVPRTGVWGRPNSCAAACQVVTLSCLLPATSRRNAVFGKSRVSHTSADMLLLAKCHARCTLAPNVAVRKAVVAAHIRSPRLSCFIATVENGYTLLSSFLAIPPC